MILRPAASILLLTVLASCPRGAPGVRQTSAPDLETAAILRGLVRDPADRDIAGLYARDTDRICIVRRDGQYRMGATVDYGDGLGCSAAGSVSRSGTRLRVRFGDDCRVEARFDGDRIIFPAEMPPGCAAYCKRRTTLAAIDVPRLSESTSEASAMRAADGSAPCGET